VSQTVKGTSLELTVELVRLRHGPTGIAELRAALPADVRGELPEDLRVLPAMAYAFRTWAEVLLAAEELYGRPISIARESARNGYRRLLKTTYARWVRDGEPLESIRRLPHLWEQVTKGLGKYEVIDGDPGTLVVRLQLEVEPRYRQITEERCAGVVEAMGEAAGGKVRVRRVVDGAHTNLDVQLRGNTIAG
jgi:hypothetical protein